MELQLTWDVVFVGVLIAVFGVAFFRPHKFTLRLLLGTYLSLIVAEGLSFFLEKIILPAAPELQNWVSERDIIFFMTLRLLFFAVSMGFFLAKGHYHIEHKKHDHWVARLIIHSVFAVLIGMLVTTSIFAFLSGNSLIEAALGSFAPNAWFDASALVEPALSIFGVWLALPAMAMLAVSVAGPQD